MNLGYEIVATSPAGVRGETPPLKGWCGGEGEGEPRGVLLICCMSRQWRICISAGSYLCNVSTASIRTKFNDNCTYEKSINNTKIVCTSPSS